jgi:hypothetical protein
MTIDDEPLGLTVKHEFATPAYSARSPVPKRPQKALKDRSGPKKHEGPAGILCSGKPYSRR